MVLRDTEEAQKNMDITNTSISENFYYISKRYFFKGQKEQNKLSILKKEAFKIKVTL